MCALQVSLDVARSGRATGPAPLRRGAVSSNGTSASALHGSVGATGLPGPSRLQTDTGLIAFTELDPGRLQSSTQLVDGPCIGRYRPRRSLDPLDGLQRHTRFVRELALFNPKHRPSSSDLFTG